MQDLFQALGDHGNTEITYEAEMKTALDASGKPMSDAETSAKIKAVFELSFVKAGSDEPPTPLREFGGGYKAGSLVLNKTPSPHKLDRFTGSDTLPRIMSTSRRERQGEAKSRAWFTSGANMLSRGLEWINEESKPDGTSALLASALESCYLFSSNRGVGTECVSQ